jgi:TRAP-type C4-dicarboxylate transport system permease small subunit
VPNQVLRAVELVTRAGAGASLAFAGVAMFTQVVMRYVFSAPLVWPEELATLLLAWITFLGAAAVQADDSHLGIDTLRAYLAPRGKVVLDLFRRGTIIVCCIVLTVQGLALSQRMWPLEFPALGITRSLLYLSVPIGFGVSLVFALRSLIRREPPRSGALEP